VFIYTLINGEDVMQSMNISLPDPLKQFVDSQVAQGRYSSTSEYMRELIRADEKLKAEEQLEAKLLEGLNSPESELGKEDWKEIRNAALNILESRKARR
jgi:antitoxin ParD1/3/4